MTVVEFYNQNAIENIISALYCQPDQVIFVGYNRKTMEARMERCRQVIRERGLPVKILPPKGISRNNLQVIVRELSNLVEKYGPCEFNLDGGEDLYLVAVGMIAEKYPDLVRLHRFNIQNNSFTDCDADGQPRLSGSVAVTIRENVRIYGGEVVDVTQHPDGTYPWDFTVGFRQDIQSLWEICCRYPNSWNGCVNTMGWAMRVQPQEDERCFLCQRRVVEPAMLEEGDRYKMNTAILRALEKEKLISWLRTGEDEIEFVFKNLQVKQALSKAGQVLELMATMAALDAVEEDGTPTYNDVCCGVYIDWDGAVEPEGNVDVANEVDVLLMRGALPVFVSCKNGGMDPEELYKLETVARRFGGKYAMKVLIAPRLDKMGDKGRYIHARATDMGIRVVEDFEEMTYEQMKREMRCLWANPQ